MKTGVVAIPTRFVVLVGLGSCLTSTCIENILCVRITKMFIGYICIHNIYIINYESW